MASLTTSREHAGPGANLLGLFAAAYEIIKEDAIYRRERMVNLGILPYLFSKLAVLGGCAPP